MSVQKEKAVIVKPNPSLLGGVTPNMTSNERVLMLLKVNKLMKKYELKNK